MCQQTWKPARTMNDLLWYLCVVIAPDVVAVDVASDDNGAGEDEAGDEEEEEGEMIADNGDIIK